MKTLETRTIFELEPHSYHEKFDGRTVEFLYEMWGELFKLIGKFIVHQLPPYEQVDIEYFGPLDPMSTAHNFYRLHLSQPHVGAITAKPGPGSDFEVAIPLFERHKVLF